MAYSIAWRGKTVAEFLENKTPQTSNRPPRSPSREPPKRRKPSRQLADGDFDDQDQPHKVALNRHQALRAPKQILHLQRKISIVLMRRKEWMSWMTKMKICREQFGNLNSNPNPHCKKRSAGSSGPGSGPSTSKGEFSKPSIDAKIEETMAGIKNWLKKKLFWVWKLGRTSFPKGDLIEGCEVSDEITGVRNQTVK